MCVCLLFSNYLYFTAALFVFYFDWHLIIQIWISWQMRVIVMIVKDSSNNFNLTACHRITWEKSLDYYEPKMTRLYWIPRKFQLFTWLLQALPVLGTLDVVINLLLAGSHNFSGPFSTLSVYCFGFACIRVNNTI